MKILLYGTSEDCILLQHVIDHCSICAYRTIFVSAFSDYNDYLLALGNEKFDIIFVMKPGADGLEGITAAKTMKEEIPRVWISDDKDFGPQAFRLGVSFFAHHPMTEEKLTLAFRRIRMN